MSKTYFFMDTTPVDQTLSSDRRETWMPHSGEGYFDQSARQYFSTKRQKRAWLIHHKMRETGTLYNPKNAPAGMEGNVRKHPRQQTCWKTAVSSLRPCDV